MAAAPAPPWARYGALGNLGDLQPLTALGASVPGVATWKPGAYSPLVRVRGTVACGSRLGDILLVLLREDADEQSEAAEAAEAAGRVVGLMLKPGCGLDELRELVGSHCQPRNAPTGRGKLPLKEYRRQQRLAAQQQAEAAAAGAPADGEDASAGPAGAAAEPSAAAAAAASSVRLELEAFVEKSKVQFLLRAAAGSDNAPDASELLPCVLVSPHAAPTTCPRRHLMPWVLS